MLTAIITSPGTTGTEEPPGITAFSSRPPRIPPASSSKSLNGIPSGTSKFPGFSTWPETENSFSPPEFAVPSSENHLPPLCMITGTEASDSVLLMVVGLPYKPKLAGNGGLKRGWPFLPSRDSSRAVSSPQI